MIYNNNKEGAKKEPQSGTAEELSILRDFLISTSTSSFPNVPSKSSSPNDPSKVPDQGVVAFLHLLTSLLPAEPSSYPCLEFTVTSAIPLGAGRSSNSTIDIKATNAKVAMSGSFIAILSLTSNH